MIKNNLLEVSFNVLNIKIRDMIFIPQFYDKNETKIFFILCLFKAYKTDIYFSIS